MSFRCVRKSNGLRSWMSLGATLLVFALLGVLGWIASRMDSMVPKAFVAIFCVLFFVVLVDCIRNIIFPFEWELVVDANQLRWGRAGDPSRQRQIPISRLVGIVHEESERRVLAETASSQILQIGEEVLVSRTDRRRFVEYLRQALPHLTIYSG